jgi:hypothetical protein
VRRHKFRGHDAVVCDIDGVRKVRALPSLSMAVARQGIANSSIFLMHAILGIDKAMVGRPARGWFFP